MSKIVQEPNNEPIDTLPIYIRAGQAIAVFNDRNLSYHAKGVYAYLVTLPTLSDVSIQSLITDANKAASVSTAIQELHAAGYLEYGHKRGKKHVARGYTLIEKPV